MDEQEIRAAIDRYASGQTFQQIGSALGFSSGTIRNYLIKNGVTPRATGSKPESRKSIEDRMHANISVDASTGCWNWTGALSAGKYGSIYYEGRMQKAHRVMWALDVGDVSAGLDLDHLCRNTKCCNPAHLEPVTRAVNLQRSPVIGWPNRAKTHCPSGHPYSGDNVVIRRDGSRQCVACRRNHNSRWNAVRAQRHGRA